MSCDPCSHTCLSHCQVLTSQPMSSGCQHQCVQWALSTKKQSLPSKAHSCGWKFCLGIYSRRTLPFPIRFASSHMSQTQGFRMECKIIATTPTHCSCRGEMKFYFTFHGKNWQYLPCTVPCTIQGTLTLSCSSLSRLHYIHRNNEGNMEPLSFTCI